MEGKRLIFRHERGKSIVWPPNKNVSENIVAEQIFQSEDPFQGSK